MSAADDSVTAVVLFRDPVSKLKITPTLFAQLPERDFMDHETGKLIPTHQLHGRVVWHGKVWLIFTDTSDPAPVLYRYEMRENTQPTIVLDTERELNRLLRVIEAIVAYFVEVDCLPVKRRICGRTFFAPLYTHPCPSVRYPMMGLGEHGEAGSARQSEIEEWIRSQGFDIKTTSAPQVEGIMQSVIEHEDILLRDWESTRDRLASTGQIFLSPEADEELLADMIKRLKGARP